MRGVACPTVVGREAEIGLLGVTLDEVTEGRGRAVFLVGEPGLGKTRLATALAATARSRGLTALTGRAVRSGAATPYRAVSEALLGGTRRVPVPLAAELAPFAPILARLVPGGPAAAHSNPGGPASPPDSPVLAGEAVLRLLRALAGGGACLLVLEDLHWADSDTLAIVEYLADNGEPEPLVVLGTLRDEPGPALTLAHRLRDRGTAHLVALGRLPTADIVAMARACLGGEPLPPAVERLVVEHAEGVPFFVEELLAALVDSGSLRRSGASWAIADRLRPSVPYTFAETVRERLDLLGGRRGVVTAAAVLGRVFDWALLAPVAGGEAEVLAGLRAAVDLQLAVESDGGRFRFRHALTREAVLDALLAAERRDLATRLLAVLESREPALAGESLELAAALAADAGQWERSGELLVEGARRALAAGALRTAADLAHRAAEVAPGHPAVVAAAGETRLAALALAGDAAGAAEAEPGVVDLLDRQLVEGDRVVALSLVLARAAVATGDGTAARTWLARARAAGVDGARAAELEVLEAGAAAADHRHPDAEDHARRALELAREAGHPDSECEALEVLGRCARRRDLGTAAAHFAAALRVAEAAGLPLARMRALHELAVEDVIVAGPSERLLAVRTVAESLGSLTTVAHVDFHLGVLATLHFDLDGADAAYGRALAAARRYRMSALERAAVTTGATVPALRGDREAVARARAWAEAEAPDDGETQARSQLALALLALAHDEVDAALDAAERAVGHVPPASGFRQSYVVQLLGLLRAVRSRPAALDPGPHPPAAMGPGMAVAARAVHLGRAGQGPAAAETFAAADRLLAGGPWFRHVVRRLVAEAAVTDGWGDPAAWLAESSAFFAAAGLDPLARACRSLLRLLGTRAPHPPRLSGLPEPLRSMGVTAREADVLALVAGGLSNRAIGERLYLSARTVEKHVERLLAKTGSANRAALAVLATRTLPQSGDAGVGAPTST